MGQAILMPHNKCLMLWWPKKTLTMIRKK